MRPGDPVRAISGVGPARAALLERLGVATVGDLLRLLPRRYEDRRRLETIEALAGAAPGTFAARVVSAGPGATPGRRRRIFRAILADGDSRVTALWFRFREPHLREVLIPGARLLVHGRVGGAPGRREILQPEIEELGDDGERGAPAVRPVYPGTGGLPQATLRTLIRRALAAALPGLDDPLPASLRRRLGLPALAESLAAVHAPGDDIELAPLADGTSPAHRRLAFDDLLALQLRLAVGRSRLERRSPLRARAIPEGLLARFRARLPFALTAAQERVSREILADLAGERPMQRLLQGDVGSGKTVVAALAAVAACAGGGQAALLVPTELLAEQHHRVIGALAGRHGLRAELLTASVPRERRASLLAGLADGTIRFVVGTHALLGEGVRFAELALAIVDEQHRFGVRQRLRLRGKGRTPDLLVMTATPIPRTLALVLYGDLDLSLIDELPPGRRPVTTRVVGEAGRRAAWDLVRDELARGRRAYVVCPLLEEGAAEDTAAAVRAAARLRAHFPETAVGLVHGRMPPDERARQLERFRSGATPLLVATTVVEVGLDVPEATVMVIERAERFGLAQLHQLRGRIGRGGDAAHCLLLTGPEVAPEARERLAALARTADGFAVAEADLAARGPGQLAGTRQAGLAGRCLAAAARDGRLLALARRVARALIDADPELALPGHEGLRALAGADSADDLGVPGGG
ncbi:MAG TPA: ATP-dependent DNA helicase RecG [Candidatus Methanoperedens sp.]|nr:ATP-dependent DNA helicase RecG [Candidatus Methanoperedens sp.]